MAYHRTPYLKTNEVAASLQISQRTLYAWLKAGKIPEPERNPLNGHRQWTLNDVESIRAAIMAAHEVRR